MMMLTVAAGLLALSAPLFQPFPLLSNARVMFHVSAFVSGVALLLYAVIQ